MSLYTPWCRCTCEGNGPIIGLALATPVLATKKASTGACSPDACRV
eukprot:CAMPEP_0175291380 /NCGR_PEP_ID=MMETSP0093-20121207/56376_1 /TAXON_ID=311494 /ORGANISM="Alexandrium monilatum, Strain CCMP3105" /LENGTH=45 /DNA_ID= /DNA_START= /DNA_END= /DNA_ORIENTATION=